MKRIPLVPINQVDCNDSDGCDEGSNEFTITVRCVDPPKPWYIHFYNLDCERILIEREHPGNGCDPMWEPWRCAGKPLTADYGSPDVLLTTPGRYRFSTESGAVFGHEVDHIRIEAGEVSLAYAQLRLQEISVCCCTNGEECSYE